MIAYRVLSFPPFIQANSGPMYHRPTENSRFLPGDSVGGKILNILDTDSGPTIINWEQMITYPELCRCYNLLLELADCNGDSSADHPKNFV